MGLFLSTIWRSLVNSFESDPARVLLLGLDAAGKTTILYKVKLNENVVTIPTIGFNVETVCIGKGISFTVWDVGGQDKLIPLWQHYFSNSDGLVFVVDSADRSRLAKARDELHAVLNNDAMRDVPVVVLCNKQDLPGAVSTAELVDALALKNFSSGSHPWYVQASCAHTGEGIYEGFYEMAKMVKQFKRQQNR